MTGKSHLLKYHCKLALLSVFILFSCTQPVEPDQAISDNPGFTGKIAFLSDRDTGLCRQIYLMNCDGSEQVRMTNDSNDYRYPVFSPDGSKILFYSNTTDDSDEIFVMDTDGSNLINLTSSPGDDNLPSYSPSGTHITFTSTRDGNREIYIMDSDGQQQTRLTFNDIIDHSPQFTPDAHKIIYYSSEPDEREYNIYIMNVDGSERECLTSNKIHFITQSFISDRSFNVFDAMPHISQDGSEIVFSSYDTKLKNYLIFRSDIGGQNLRLLANEPGYNLAPFYTPDGRSIIFRSHRGGNYDIYKMKLDGQNQINLTNGSGHAYFAQFSPDGSKILFYTDRNRYYKIWIMNLDGSSQTQLTFGEYNDYQPTLF